jgi:hypothetical protein
MVLVVLRYKSEKEDSLVIVDGVKAHFNSKLDIDHLSED